jgi:3-oxoacyl-[acyl-carrier protein] reductase
MTNSPGERRSVLVTGGGRGLGAAIVRVLAEAGHDVTFTYRSAVDGASALVADLTRARPQQRFSARQVDLADTAAIAAFIAEIGAGPPYSALVHNAGQAYDSLAATLDQAKAKATMQVNFWSFTKLAGALIRTMTRARDGRIVAIGSITALRASQGSAAYAASKAALLAYVRTLAVETARRGVTVNYVAPGFVDTEMMTPYAAYREKIEQQIPAGRFARPDDVAQLVAFLLSGKADYVTGAMLAVDGGLSAAIGIHR